MIRFLTVVCLLVAFVLFLTACPKKQALVEKPVTQVPSASAPTPIADSNTQHDNAGTVKPQITFESTLHDFGVVSPGSNNSCEFKFKSTGTGLLKIQDIKATCGCTTTKLEKNDYHPGESGTIHVKYHAPSVARTDVKHIYVTTNIAENPKVELTIKAEVVPVVSVIPQKIELSLRQPNAACPTLILSSNDGNVFAIKQIESTGDCITIDFDPNQQANRFILQPTVDVEKLRQLVDLEGVIFIDVTHPNCQSVNVKFSAASEFKVDPPAITILKAEPNKPILKSVVIHNIYNEPFEIESVESRFGITKLQQQTKDPNGPVALDLLITPVLEKNRKNMFTDVITVKIKNGQSVRINCRGFYAKLQDKPQN